VRELADAERVTRFMRELGAAARAEATCSPPDCVPLQVGWRDRCPFVAQEGRLVFRHFDRLWQALAKLERAHERDLEDVRQLIAIGMAAPDRLLAAFAEIDPSLGRFPAIDAGRFRERVEEAAR
jgi:hypothetical protein